jgi:hypothetical protein
MKTVRKGARTLGLISKTRRGRSQDRKRVAGDQDYEVRYEAKEDRQGRGRGQARGEACWPKPQEGGEGAPAIERHAWQTTGSASLSPSATLARTGCRDLLIYCQASNCSTLMNADHLPDDLPIRRSVREWCARGAATEARTCGRIGPSSKRAPQ